MWLPVGAFMLASVTHYSKRIHPGDRIVAVGDTTTDTRENGFPIVGREFDLQAALKGDNVPGSKVCVTLRKLSGASMLQ